MAQENQQSFRLNYQPERLGTSQNERAQDYVPMEADVQAPYSRLDAQTEALLASKEALEAQVEAQKALEKAFVKQLLAQEKAQQASQQITAQSETANKAAVLAARQAVLETAKEQKEAARQYVDQHALAAAHSNQGGPQIHAYPNQQSASSPIASSQRFGVQPGFPPGHPGLAQRDEQRSFVARDLLLQGANRAAAEAESQMRAAQQLASNSQSPDSQQQQKAKEIAAAAQQRMEFAQQMAVAAQVPETALQAAAALSGNN